MVRKVSLMMVINVYIELHRDICKQTNVISFIAIQFVQFFPKASKSIIQWLMCLISFFKLYINIEEMKTLVSRKQPLLPTWV